MKKLLFVFGTRPEAIKMAPLVIKAKDSKLFNVKVCVTGQHREMLDQVVNFFGIQPDFDLNLMRPNQTLNDVAKFVIEGLDKILSSESIDCVLVHGDTTTTMASSLAAFHRKVPIAHIEAGLRTHDMYSPWPEEMNRRVAGLLTRWHFAPTAISEKNLLNEGVPQGHIHVTGNTVIDALHLVVKQIESKGAVEKELSEKFPFLNDKKRMILVTGHRRENFGAQFIDICKGIRKLAENHDVQIVYPVHLNPNVQTPVKEILGDVPNIYLLPPQDYVPFVYLMTKSYLIITDSGGVQEEAPSLQKPVLVMRETTERPEAVAAGTVKLVGPSGKKIYEEATLLLKSESEYQKMAGALNPYGDGNACGRIVEVLAKELEL
ncbi:non-hydrolyzing UDP-N-acetylglucosamine 2-epimerase [Bdellovibrio bacteriovorus]|uniref:non-hydrolyzing UDP-N-acetylglucosamine 2-epimerase n=1 Tax=Bdellovibrio bacteriovorus TaxID=959 RepID=UPI003A800579